MSIRESYTFGASLAEEESEQQAQRAHDDAIIQHVTSPAPPSFEQVLEQHITTIAGPDAAQVEPMYLPTSTVGAGHARRSVETLGGGPGGGPQVHRSKIGVGS